MSKETHIPDKVNTSRDVFHAAYDFLALEDHILDARQSGAKHVEMSWMPSMSQSASIVEAETGILRRENKSLWKRLRSLSKTFILTPVRQHGRRNAEACRGCVKSYSYW